VQAGLPIVDSIKSKGQYEGTYLAWVCTIAAGGAKAKLSFMWIEAKNFPTIDGTGTEDYCGGSYNFENQEKKQYEESG
jgi:hypothetical protein